MNKFDSYLINEYHRDDEKGIRGKNLSMDEAMNMIKKKCKLAWQQWIDESSFISRISYSGRSEFSFMDTSKMDYRMSKNTLNYYTHIINNDPSWSAFPRRQLIASAGARSNMGNGSRSVYIIFPFDGTKIGICSSSDIWVSFDAVKKHQLSANSLNQFIQDILNKADGNYGASIQDYDESWGELKRQCKVFDFWFQAKDLENKEERKMATAMRKHELLSGVEYYDFGWVFDFYNDNLYKALTQIYSPKGFKIATSGRNDLPISKSPEVWFDGPCVLISSESAIAIRNKEEGLT